MKTKRFALKKRCVRLVGIVLTLLMLPVSSVGAESVNIPDAQLKAVLCEKLGVSAVTTEALSGITELDLSERNIQNLSGLSRATELTELSLKSNPISDISELSSLTKLQTLELSSTAVRDLSVLAELTELRVVHLDNLPIFSLEVLLELPKLQFVFCTANNQTVKEQIALLEQRGVYVQINEATSVQITPKTGTSLKIDSENGLLTNVPANTSAEALLAMLECTADMQLVNDDGAAITGKAGTGAHLRLSSGGSYIGELIIVVYGDATGDGELTVTDLMQIKAKILNKSSLTGAKALALDYNQNDEVSVSDFLKLKALLL